MVASDKCSEFACQRRLLLALTPCAVASQGARLCCAGRKDASYEGGGRRCRGRSLAALGFALFTPGTTACTGPRSTQASGQSPGAGLGPNAPAPFGEGDGGQGRGGGLHPPGRLLRPLPVQLVTGTARLGLQPA